VWVVVWWVGFLVGSGVEGGAGGAAVVGATGAVGALVGWTVAVGVLVGVGVFCVGPANIGAIVAGSSDPAALWGHQATRQAARPRNAARAMRTANVQLLVTTSSWPRATEGERDALRCEGIPLALADQKIQRTTDWAGCAV
jgi:hypothetical protein